MYDGLVLRGAWWSIDAKHFQMVMKTCFSSPPTLNKRIEVCLRWDVSSPTGHVVSARGQGTRVCIPSRV